IGVDAPIAPHHQAKNKCHMNAVLAAPLGQYVSAVSQSISYGVVKGSGDTVSLSSSAKLMNVSNDLSASFPTGSVVDDALLVTTSPVTDLGGTNAEKKQCHTNGGRQVPVHIDIELDAYQAQANGNVLIAVDSNDLKLT